MLAYQRQLVGQLDAERVGVEVAPLGRRQPDEADTDSVDVEQRARLRARHDLPVAGGSPRGAGSRPPCLVDERVDAVPDHRPVAHGDRLAAGNPQEPVRCDALGQVAQTLGRVLHVACVDVEHGRVTRLGARALDERGDACECVDTAVDVVRVQDDQPAHAFHAIGALSGSGGALSERGKDLVLLGKRPSACFESRARRRQGRRTGSSRPRRHGRRFRLR